MGLPVSFLGSHLLWRQRALGSPPGDAGSLTSETTAVSRPGSFLVLQVQAVWPQKVPHRLWGPVTFLESICLPGLS